MNNDSQAGAVDDGEHLIVRDLGDELVIYDPRSDEAHRLSGPARDVWLSDQAGVPAPKGGDGEAITAALHAKGLLRSGFSRRTLLRGAVIGGGAVVAVPLIESIAAPAAFALCSPQGVLCSPDGPFDIYSEFHAATGSNTVSNNSTGNFWYYYGTSPTAAPTTKAVYNAATPAQFQEAGGSAYVGFPLSTSTLANMTPRTGSSSSGATVGVAFKLPAGTNNSGTTTKVSLTFQLDNTATNRTLTWTVSKGVINSTGTISSLTQVSTGTVAASTAMATADSSATQVPIAHPDGCLMLWLTPGTSNAAQPVKLTQLSATVTY